jgi:hypothetical protein
VVCSQAQRAGNQPKTGQSRGSSRVRPPPAAVRRPSARSFDALVARSPLEPRATPPWPSLRRYSPPLQRGADTEFGLPPQRFRPVWQITLAHQLCRLREGLRQISPYSPHSEAWVTSGPVDVRLGVSGRSTRRTYSCQGTDAMSTMAGDGQGVVTTNVGRYADRPVARGIVTWMSRIPLRYPITDSSAIYFARSNHLTLLN